MTTDSLARQDLLDRVVDHLREQGIRPEMSLRSIAAAVGTSHRMLGYHFGSRDGLLAAVLGAMRVDQQQSLIAAAAGWRRRDAILALWSFYSAPSRAAEARSFFYVFGLAAQDPGPYQQFLQSLSDWVEVITGLGVAEGRDPQAAADEARLLVACFRGLVLEVTITDDHESVNRAFARLLDVLESLDEQAALSAVPAAG